jgi:hypothetical protein
MTPEERAEKLIQEWRKDFGPIRRRDEDTLTRLLVAELRGLIEQNDRYREALEHICRAPMRHCCLDWNPETLSEHYEDIAAEAFDPAQKEPPSKEG